VISSIIHLGVEVQIEVSLYVQISPAILTKRLGKDKVEGGFLPTMRAHNTIVAISFQLVFLSSNGVFDIESIHQQ
jgi:hypothetical protein